LIPGHLIIYRCPLFVYDFNEIVIIKKILDSRKTTEHKQINGVRTGKNHGEL